MIPSILLRPPSPRAQDRTYCVLGVSSKGRQFVLNLIAGLGVPVVDQLPSQIDALNNQHQVWAFGRDNPPPVDLARHLREPHYILVAEDLGRLTFDRALDSDVYQPEDVVSDLSKAALALHRLSTFFTPLSTPCLFVSLERALAQPDRIGRDLKSFVDAG